MPPRGAGGAGIPRGRLFFHRGDTHITQNYRLKRAVQRPLVPPQCRVASTPARCTPWKEACTHGAVPPPPPRGELSGSRRQGATWSCEFCSDTACVSMRRPPFRASRLAHAPFPHSHRQGCASRRRTLLFRAGRPDFTGGGAPQGHVTTEAGNGVTRPRVKGHGGGPATAGGRKRQEGSSALKPLEMARGLPAH